MSPPLCRTQHKLIFLDIAASPSPADVATIAVGAYEPRWLMKAQHIDPANALKAANVPAERFTLFKHGETRVWDAATSRLVTTITEVPKENTRPRDDSLAAQ